MVQQTHVGFLSAVIVRDSPSRTVETDSIRRPGFQYLEDRRAAIFRCKAPAVNRQRQNLLRHLFNRHKSSNSNLRGMQCGKSD